MWLSQVDSDVYVAITDGQCCVCLSRVNSVVYGYRRWTELCVAITGGQGYVGLLQVDCAVCGYHR